MAESSNVMEITQKGLSSISKILVNSYIYNGDIDIIGTPTVDSLGIARNLGPDSYFEKRGLTFLSNLIQVGDTLETHTLEVNFTGTLVDSGIAFTLLGANNLEIYVSPSTVAARTTTGTLVSINNLSISAGQSIKVTLRIGAANIELGAYIGGVSYSNTTEIFIDTSAFNGVLIGSNGLGSGSYWKNTIDLSRFSIYQDEKVVYAPATKEDITFSSILVSDANFMLTNESVPFIGAIYEIPLTEIARTGNNILLKADIPSSVHLKIGNVGLYCYIAGKRYLFSLITGLNLNKGKDLPYELIFHVNIDINVVNTSIRPEIILNEYEMITKSSLEDVKKALLWDDIDIERVIKKNAINLGFNRPQVFYREEKHLQESIRGFQSATRLSNLRNLYDLPPSLFYSSIGETLNSYRLYDLTAPEKTLYLDVLDGAFTGSDSIIDLSTPSTLILKTNWADISDRVILAKVNLNSSDIYFVLQLENGSLIFKYYTEEESFSMSYELVPEVISKFLGDKALVIIRSENLIKLYLNLEELCSVNITEEVPIYIGDNFSLTNYIGSAEGSENFSFSDLLYFSKTLTSSEMSTVLRVLGTI